MRDPTNGERHERRGGLHGSATLRACLDLMRDVLSFSLTGLKNKSPVLLIRKLLLLKIKQVLQVECVFAFHGFLYNGFGPCLGKRVMAWIIL